ncbi:MAG: glycosyltransferase family 4 protein [Anaerolineales bacterium]|nr:glycosyltransferase family 4 protein [Anaerolineales bacterium]
MPTKILYTAFDIVPSPKGASTHILHFIRGLVNSGYDVHLFTPGNGVLPEEEQLEGAQVTRIALPTEDNFLERAILFGQGVLEHVTQAQQDQLSRYHIAHYRSIWGGFQLAQAKVQLGYKTLFEVNGLPSVELKYHYPGLRESGLLAKIREQEIATLLMSDAIICPSEVTRLFLISLGASPRRITVIPNGVSAKDFAATPLPKADGHTPIILYVGTLADWQGLDVLISAMPLILTRLPARLRIIGHGRSRQRKALAKQIRKLGLEEQVEIAAAVPHHLMPEVIAQADLCVAPLSLNDRNITQGCCPIKVIEYMASGRPLVASNLPVVRELVREDMDGLLFTPGDAQDLAQQILTLLENPDLAKRLADSAAERANSKFTWHAAQKKLLSVYRRLSDR